MKAILAIAVLLLFSSGCFGCNECSFWSRCDGDVLEVCGEGPDQVVGRDIRRFPCEAPNETCATHGDRNQYASCVRAPKVECDVDSFDAYCDSNVLVDCGAGWEQGRDCTSDGPVCVVGDNGAICAVDPITSCDPETYEVRCDGLQRYSCTSAGYEKIRTCKLECVESETTAAVYCRDS